MSSGGAARIEEEPGIERNGISPGGAERIEEEPGNSQKGNLAQESAAEAQINQVDRTISSEKGGIKNGDGGKEVGMGDQEERMIEEDGTLLEYHEKVKKLDGNEAVATDGTYSLINRCLYFSDWKTASLRLCIPEALIGEILRLCHDKCGYPGIRNTYTGLALQFYFPRMSRRVKQYVATCSQCQLVKLA